ncbi:MAG: NADH-quinone oxidoreductase subunit C [Burkholderiaceae bacterium]
MSTPVLDRVKSELGAWAQEAVVSHGVLVISAPTGGVLPLVHMLKGRGFDMFLDVTAVDWLGQAPRFEVVWHFYSTTHKVRVRVKARVTEEQPEVDSLVPLYGSAAFMERECHEMYGIRFRGNADLRPLLLYEGFVGFPLRKDYAKEQEQPLVPYREGFQ